jgi:hypothetical protein
VCHPYPYSVYNVRKSKEDFLNLKSSGEKEIEIYLKEMKRLPE